MVVVFLVALRLAFPTRWYAGAAALGIVAAVALLTLPGSSGGSSVILLNYAGITWTIAPAVLAAAVVGWPRLARRQRVLPDADGILGNDHADPIGGAKDD
jgi:drug/metabolite transporter (DMT)-like permease